MIRRPPRSTPLYSSAASDVYKRQTVQCARQLSKLILELSGFGPPNDPSSFDSISTSPKQKTATVQENSDNGVQNAVSLAPPRDKAASSYKSEEQVRETRRGFGHRPYDCKTQETIGARRARRAPIFLVFSGVVVSSLSLFSITNDTSPVRKSLENSKVNK